MIVQNYTCAAEIYHSEEKATRSPKLRNIYASIEPSVQSYWGNNNKKTTPLLLRYSDRFLGNQTPRQQIGTDALIREKVWRSSPGLVQSNVK